MTQERIDKGNKLIAKFMGLKVIPSGTKAIGQINHPEVPEAFLTYNFSWNKLMPVVEKIFRLKIGDGITKVDYANCRTFGMINNETGLIMVRFNGFTVHCEETLIEAAYSAVLEFIEWYNENI